MTTLTVQEVTQCDESHYEICLSFQQVLPLKVKKSQEELIAFFTKVMQTSIFVDRNVTFQSVTDLTIETIQSDLAVLLEVLGEDIWMHLEIIAFFDESSQNQSVLTRLHLSFLTKQLSMMQKLMTEYDKRIAIVEQKYADAFKTAMMPDTELNTFISKSTSSAVQLENKEQQVVNNSTSSVVMMNKKATAELRSDASFHSSEESQSSDFSDSDEEDTGKLESNRQKHSEEAGNLQAESIADSLLRLEEATIKIQDEMLEILRFITPTETNFGFGSTIFNFLRGQSRLSVNSSLFGVGLSEIGCNLPDDIIEYSVLLSKNHFPTWHTSLCERLIAVSEGSVEAWVDGSDFNPTLKVSDVRYTSDDSSSTTFSVSCSIDESKVVISSNKRHDLCFIAFFEEVSSLVGKNFLFKKSLLLIRAWWNYESATYVEREVKHYLSNHVICIMICMIFNKYHWRIETPQQALLFFLAEFCQYNPKQHVITLQGIVNYQSTSKTPLQLIPPHPRHLISFEVLEKYWHLFNIGAANQSNGHNPVFSSQMMTDSMTKTQFNPYQTNSIVSFDRVGFNVLHPFTHVSMISERLSSRRVGLISKVFLVGASTLSHHLKQVMETGNAMANFSTNFFPKLILKYSPLYQTALLRHDNLRSVFDGNILHYIVERIWQNVLHCNFVLESVITESAILTASMENLSVKGPLPVGEVGKMLTEVSCMPQLSLHLKEKFGGLKKFLEKFPEIFVYSNDHPFNPHVLLRSSLLPEHQKMIYRGVIPIQVMTQYKKSSAKKTLAQKQQDPMFLGVGGSAALGVGGMQHGSQGFNPSMLAEQGGGGYDSFSPYASNSMATPNPAPYSKPVSYINTSVPRSNFPPAATPSYNSYSREPSFGQSNFPNATNKFGAVSHAAESNDPMWGEYQGNNTLGNRNMGMFGNSTNAVVGSSNNLRNEFPMMNNSRFSMGQSKEEFYREGNESNNMNSSTYLSFPPSTGKERTSSNDYSFGRFDTSMDPRYH